LKLGLTPTSPGPPQADRSQEARERSIAAIEKLGGEVIRDEEMPGVIDEVDLGGPNIADAALTHLTALSDLRSLDLSKSRISDAGLANLQELKRLRRLDLSNTPINGAGFKYLKALQELDSLELWNCPITNASLADLKGVGKLSYLGLSGTSIDDKGLEKVAMLTDLSRSISAITVSPTPVWRA